MAHSVYHSLLSRGALSCLLHLQKYSLLLENSPYSLAVQEFILFKQAFKVLLHIADPSSQLGLLWCITFSLPPFPLAELQASKPAASASNLPLCLLCTTTWLYIVFYSQ